MRFFEDFSRFFNLGVDFLENVCYNGGRVWKKHPLCHRGAFCRKELVINRDEPVLGGATEAHKSGAGAGGADLTLEGGLGLI